MMSFLAMLKFVPRWAYILLGVVAMLVGLTHWHNGRVDDAVVAERDRLGAVYAQEVADAQAKADEKTQANATQTAQLDTSYFKEYQNATKNANYWRARAQSERVPNQANCATNNATPRTSGSMGNDPTTAAIDNRPLDLPSTAIIELSTIAGQMRAQVEYLQAKHQADVRTVNKR